MKAQPVHASEEPAYPRRTELLADRSILDKRQPRRWRTRSGFAAAVAMLLATQLTGCGDGRPRPAFEDPFGPPEPSVAAASDWVRSIFDNRPSPAYLGCVVIMQPGFFPEDEAIPASTIQAFQELGSKKD